MPSSPEHRGQRPVLTEGECGYKQEPGKVRKGYLERTGLNQGDGWEGGSPHRKHHNRQAAQDSLRPLHLVRAGTEPGSTRLGVRPERTPEGEWKEMRDE